jgi:hypothetical protein
MNRYGLTNEQREARREERYRAIIAISDLFNHYREPFNIDIVYRLLKTPTISRKTLKRIYRHNHPLSQFLSHHK